MNWNNSITNQISTFSTALKSIDMNVYNNVLGILLPGERIIFTGIGKSGLVARHLSSTYNSLCINSLFMDPVSSMHGDMGLLNSTDILIAISNSGNTSELIHFLKYCSHLKKINIIGVHSTSKSFLDTETTLSVNLPFKREADHWNLVPTTSSLIYMAYLQSIAVDLSKKRGIKKEDFLKNHPGGSIGANNS